MSESDKGRDVTEGATNPSVNYCKNLDGTDIAFFGMPASYLHPHVSRIDERQLTKLSYTKPGAKPS